MQIKGSILLILLIMLLFASAALLQLSEDNYLAHLIAAHLNDLSHARRELSDSFRKISVMSVKNQACYSDTDNKDELEVFWKSRALCQVKSSNQRVDYVFRVFQQNEQESSYLQYILRVKNNDSSVWLRVVAEQETGAITAWSYSSR